MAIQYNSAKIPHLENISVWYDVSNPKCFNITEAIYNSQPLPYAWDGISANPNLELEASEHFEKYVGTSTDYDFSHLTNSSSGPYEDAATGNVLSVRFQGPSRPQLGLRDLSGNNRSITLFTNPLRVINTTTFSGYGTNADKSRTVVLPLKGKWYYEPCDLKYKDWHSSEIGHYIQDEYPDRETNSSDTAQLHHRERNLQ